MNEKLINNFEEAFYGFDFQKVRQVMRLLEWTWLGESDPPTVQQMEKEVRHLFEEACKNLGEENSASTVGTGGFEVTVYNSGNVFIRFVAEESSVDWEE